MLAYRILGRRATARAATVEVSEIRCREASIRWLSAAKKRVSGGGAKKALGARSGGGSSADRADRPPPPPRRPAPAAGASLGTPRTGLSPPAGAMDTNWGKTTTTSPLSSSAPSSASPLLRDDAGAAYERFLQETSERARTAARIRGDSTSADYPSLGPDDSGVSAVDPSDVIDMKTIYDPSIHLPDKPNFLKPLQDGSRYEVATPLGDELMALIGVAGPMNVAEYIRLALRHPEFGYYTAKAGLPDDIDEDDKLFDDNAVAAVSEAVEGAEPSADDDWDDEWDNVPNADGALGINDDAPETGPGSKIIGPRGDFTTAPEISQIFGEMLAVWFLTQWKDLGKPKSVRLVEVGPGRGTLICDMLRSASNLIDGDFCQALAGGSGGGGAGIHLVEVGRHMREEQRQKLAALGDELGGINFRLGDVGGSEAEDPVTKALRERSRVHERQGSNEGGGDSGGVGDDILAETLSRDEKGGDVNPIHVEWHSDLINLPIRHPVTDEVIPTFIVCQEIIDALPVHVFQKTEDGWRERMVDVVSTDDDKNYDAKEDAGDGKDGSGDTSGFKDVEMAELSSGDMKKKKRPRLRFVLAPEVTPAVRTLLNVDDRGKMRGEDSHLDDSKPGDVLEVCPEGMMLAQDVAKFVNECTGAALIIDYGDEGTGDTLRAFRRHGQEDVLSLPGRSDITTDVDFAALRRAVSAGKWRGTDASPTKGEEAPLAFGPVSQGQFLASMGVMERVMALIQDDKTTDEQAEELVNALERLTQSEHMGERYKVMAIAKKKEGIFPPPGF